MKKHTKRVIGIFKEVLVDIKAMKAKGIEMGVEAENIFAYTPKTTTPNLTVHDIERMVLELECECNHPNGMFTECFAPETCCPDQLITFSHGGKHVAVNCQPTCVHHCKHQKMPEMTNDEHIEEILKGRT